MVRCACLVWQEPNSGTEQTASSGTYPGASLVYSPVTRIMRPVISPKGLIEHRDRGATREAFRREVRGCGFCLLLLTVRGRLNRFGRVSCIGDQGGSVFHILFFIGLTLPKTVNLYSRNHAPATNSVLRSVSKMPRTVKSAGQ